MYKDEKGGLEAKLVRVAALLMLILALIRVLAPEFRAVLKEVNSRSQIEERQHEGRIVEH